MASTWNRSFRVGRGLRLGGPISGPYETAFPATVMPVTKWAIAVSLVAAAAIPTFASDNRFNIVRLGLNYRFGDLGKAPLGAKY